MLLEAFVHDPQTGEYVWNDLTYYVRPYFMAPFDDVNDATNPQRVVVPAGGTRTSYFRLEDDGVFMGAYFLANLVGVPGTAALNDLLVDIYDDVRKRPLTARPCHVMAVFGSGRRPGVLSEPIWMDRNETLVFTFTDNSGSGGSIYPVIHGQRIYNDRVHDQDLNKYVLQRTLRSRQVLPYFAPLDSDVELDANQEIDFYYSQPADFHFEVRKILYYADPANPIYPYFKMYDEGEQQLTYDWIATGLGTGWADRPVLTFGPLLIRAGTKWRFKMREYLGATGKGFFTLVGRQLVVG